MKAIGKWMLFTLGRVMAWSGDLAWQTLSRWGWKLIDRFATKRQSLRYSQRQMLTLQQDLADFAKEMDAVRSKEKPKVVPNPPGPAN